MRYYADIKKHVGKCYTCAYDQRSKIIWLKKINVMREDGLLAEPNEELGKATPWKATKKADHTIKNNHFRTMGKDWSYLISGKYNKLIHIRQESWSLWHSVWGCYPTPQPRRCGSSTLGKTWKPPVCCWGSSGNLEEGMETPMPSSTISISSNFGRNE